MKNNNWKFVKIQTNFCEFKIIIILPKLVINIDLQHEHANVKYF